jgi:protein gp37
MKWLNGEPVFNGILKERPPEHRDWGLPFRYKGAANPVMGPGQRSIIFVGSMSDVFHEHRRKPVIDQIVGRLAVSGHIGMLLTKRADVMTRYFLAERPPRLLKIMQENLWLGFSAEQQHWFDKRWAHMRLLAERGWFVFVAVNPMLGPVILPPDFLAYGDRTWVVNEGEDRGKHWRWMDPDWARALRDQCKEANIPYFFRQMAGEGPIPPDLQNLHEFPKPYCKINNPA